jgi:hypothetical protein
MKVTKAAKIWVDYRENPNKNTVRSCPLIESETQKFDVFGAERLEASL